MISGPGAIRFRGQVLVVSEDVIRMACDMSITVRFVPEGRVPTGVSGGERKSEEYGNRRRARKARSQRTGNPFEVRELRG
jgi:hypothetical protein